MLDWLLDCPKLHRRLLLLLVLFAFAWGAESLLQSNWVWPVYLVVWLAIEIVWTFKDEREAARPPPEPD